MRVLKFIVNGQTISQDPNCDFSGLFPNSNGYIQAKFSFSKEWENCMKVAAFYSNLGIEYPPRVLNNSNTCMIPVEVLRKSIFKVKVLGKSDEYNLETNKVTVHQRGGN